jgi:hypothetical protein
MRADPIFGRPLDQAPALRHADAAYDDHLMFSIHSFMDGPPRFFSAGVSIEPRFHPARCSRSSHLKAGSPGAEAKLCGTPSPHRNTGRLGERSLLSRRSEVPDARLEQGFVVNEHRMFGRSEEALVIAVGSFQDINQAHEHPGAVIERLDVPLMLAGASLDFLHPSIGAAS